MFTQLLMYMNTNQIVTKHGVTGAIPIYELKTQVEGMGSEAPTA